MEMRATVTSGSSVEAARAKKPQERSIYVKQNICVAPEFGMKQLFCPMNHYFQVRQKMVVANSGTMLGVADLLHQ